MTAPNFSDADFLSAMQGLMPRGRAWPRDPEAIQTKTLSAMAPTYRRNSDRSANLIADAFPASTLELLPEWEESLGLPDPCAGASPTLQARRAQVLARFTGNGGQSIAYFVAYAAALGFTINVGEFAPFRVGLSRVGDPLCDEDWAFTWSVQSPLNTITYFRTGQSGVGEPLASWGNAVLECELSALSPAHSILQFQYI